MQTVLKHITDYSYPVIALAIIIFH